MLAEKLLRVKTSYFLMIILELPLCPPIVGFVSFALDRELNFVEVQTSRPWNTCPKRSDGFKFDLSVIVTYCCLLCVDYSQAMELRKVCNHPLLCDGIEEDLIAKHCGPKSEKSLTSVRPSPLTKFSPLLQINVKWNYVVLLDGLR